MQMMFGGTQMPARVSTGDERAVVDNEQAAVLMSVTQAQYSQVTLRILLGSKAKGVCRMINAR